MTLTGLLATALFLTALVPVGAAEAVGPLDLPVNTVAVGSVAHDIALEDTPTPQFACVVTDGGLTVLGFAPPASPAFPSVHGFVAVPYAQGVEVRGSFAYVASKTRGLQIVDISNPDAPQLAGRVSIPSTLDVAIRGNIAYVSTGSGEFYVVNVSDPLHPRLVTTSDHPAARPIIGVWPWGSPEGDEYGLNTLNSYITNGNGKLTGIWVSGDHLVLVEWGYGRLYYYNVSVPESPEFAGTFYAPYLLKAIVDAERRIIYMHSAYGMTSGIYSVELDYLAPNFAAEYRTCAPRCGFIKNGYLTVGLDQGGLALAEGGRYLVYNGGRVNGELHVLDVENPAELSEATEWRTIGPHRVGTMGSMGMVTLGDLVYLAAGALGVQIYQVDGLAGAPPSLGLGGLAINGGAASTATQQVTLNHTASGAPTEYRASESATFVGAAWQPYAAAPAFTLSAGFGPKQVYLQLRNATEVSGIASDTINVVDVPPPPPTAPSLLSFAINNGTSPTKSRVVSLAHTASGNPTEYRASESSTFVGAPWQPYTPSPSFTLSAVNATKRVYLQLRNATGQSTTRNDTILLVQDLPNLATFAINGGAASAPSPSVTLNHTVGANPPVVVVEYRASELSTFADTTWQPYSSAPTFTLSPGSGTKKVYLQVRTATDARSVVRYDTITRPP